jgi:hypothetical protein
VRDAEGGDPATFTAVQARGGRRWLLVALGILSLGGLAGWFTLRMDDSCMMAVPCFAAGALLASAVVAGRISKRWLRRVLVVLLVLAGLAAILLEAFEICFLYATFNQ